VNDGPEVVLILATRKATNCITWDVIISLELGDRTGEVGRGRGRWEGENAMRT